MVPVLHLTFCKSPQPLHLSQTSKHLLKEQKISYPMHVSGHEMVEWVQRHACATCAKLSETVWLAGSDFFMGATPTEGRFPRNTFIAFNCFRAFRAFVSRATGHK
jgi:hypothetical protein